jgi:3-dehydrosphinganine reductase
MRRRFSAPGRAMITGGSSGIGLALARLLAERGMELVLLARRPEPLEQAGASLHPDARRALLIGADVTDPLSLQAVVSRLRGMPLQLLVNSAGVVHPGLCQDSAEEQIDRQLDTNLYGLIHATRVFLPLMQRGAAVLNLASFSGLLGTAGYAAYAASKFGVIGFSEALRRELLRKDISVHVACPMDVDTPMYRGELAAMPAWMDRGHVSRPRPAAEEAGRILRGLERGRFLILTGPESRLYWALLRHLPTLSRLMVDRIMPRP